MRTLRMLTHSLLLCGCLLLWTSCGKNVVVLPDSRQLIPAIKCPEGMTCAVDPGRIVLDRGYLRGIMQDLEACAEP